MQLICAFVFTNAKSRIPHYVAQFPHDLNIFLFSVSIKSEVMVINKSYRKVPKFSDARKFCCNQP